MLHVPPVPATVEVQEFAPLTMAKSVGFVPTIVAVTFVIAGSLPFVSVAVMGALVLPTCSLLNASGDGVRVITPVPVPVRFTLLRHP
jgi:hypothetical protein